MTVDLVHRRHGWAETPLKYVVTYNDDVLPESTPTHLAFSYVEISDVSSLNGVERSSRVSFGEAPSRARRITRNGDVLVSTVRTYLRAIAAVEGFSEAPVVSTGFAVLRATDRITSSFLKYLCLSEPFVASIIAHSTGVSYPAINAADLVRTKVLLPPVDEQALITDFLDRELVRIDTLIAKQESLMATLREDRAATISHSVTSGLDASVKMQESGVRGLAPIPATWSVMPFLRCVLGRVDYRGATPKKVDDGVLLITARNVRTGWIDYKASEEYVAAEDYDEIMRRGLPEVGDLLFTMEAPLGNAALVDRTDVALAQRIIKFRPDRRIVLPHFLLYSVLGQWFQSQLVVRATGSTALGLKASKLPELRIVLPAVDEQKRIVEFLNERWVQIEELIRKSTQVIEVLREYRSALITDVMTGMIDVREAR